MDTFFARKADRDDLELLAEFRLDFVHELKPFADTASRQAAGVEIQKWLARHQAGERLAGYLGFAGELPVCCAALLLYDLPPMDGAGSRRTGHLLNFYVLPGYRGRGYGRALLRFIQEDARRSGLFRIVLNATEAGEPLYRSEGFHEKAEPCLVWDP